MPAPACRACRPGCARGGPVPADRASPGCPPHAAVDARRDRGDAGAEPISPPPRSTRAAEPATTRRGSAQQRRADLLIPVVKAWCTDLGVEIASTGIQVHGGMGYIEETGAAQYLSRRADRADLRGHQRHPGERSGRPQARPRRRRGGARAVRRDARRSCPRSAAGPDGSRCIAASPRGSTRSKRATAYLVEAEPALAAAGSSPYLALFGTVRRRLADGAPRARRRGRERSAAASTRVCRGEAGDGTVLRRAFSAARPRLPAGDRGRRDGGRIRPGAALRAVAVFAVCRPQTQLLASAISLESAVG